MGTWKYLVVILLAAAVSISANAQEAAKEETSAGAAETTEDSSDGREAEPEPETPVAPRQTDLVDAAKERFRDVDEVISGTSLAGTDIEAHNTQREAFQTAMKDDAEFGRLWALNYKQAFEHALTSDAFKKWEDPSNVGGEAWLRKEIRLRVLDFRLRALAGIPGQLKKLAKRLAKVEAEKATLSEGEYVLAKQGLESATRLLDGLHEVARALPEPSAAEKTLLEESTAEPTEK